MGKVNIFWFRRDLRIEDNRGLSQALMSEFPVVPIFIFDTDILDSLEDKQDRRVFFIYQALTFLHEKLNTHHSNLNIYYGKPFNVFKKLITSVSVSQVFTNIDYEPYATKRDSIIESLLNENNIKFSSFKDQVIFDRDDIVKENGIPYCVFTPYSRAWKNKLTLPDYRSVSQNNFNNFLKDEAKNIIPLSDIGFSITDDLFPKSYVPDTLLKNYADNRNQITETSTSRLSVHLRFGTISIRQLVSQAIKCSDKFLDELIWREFYQTILWHYPEVVNRSFKPAYDNIKWRNDEIEFQRWCTGNTGYPIVDAGMRELNKTGFMHNRARMITASFLVKHLLIDWRWGEAYFAAKLIDYDLASNNGSWQWITGSGCDSAPYFRIFNPSIQTKKFDAKLNYINKWIPELNSFEYPQPIVDHDFARKRCLEVYSKALKIHSENL